MGRFSDLLRVAPGPVDPVVIDPDSTPGVDTSGKGGAQGKTIGLMDQVGVRTHSFKALSEDERSHDFLWRIEKAVPKRGFLGVCDRSHYEDVLIEHIRSFAPPEEIERRYGAIDDFEQRLVDNGTRVLKVMLERCSTGHGPWHIVPADGKWCRDLALAHLLKEALESLGLVWPAPDFDLEVERTPLDVDTVS